MPATKVDPDELTKKRREMLARCYEIILSPDWGKPKEEQSEEIPTQTDGKGEKS